MMAVCRLITITVVVCKQNFCDSRILILERVQKKQSQIVTLIWNYEM